MVPRAMLFAMVALALTTGIAAANDKHLVKDTVTVGNGEYDASLFIVIPCVFSMLFAVYLYWRVSLISIEKRDGADQVCFDELKMCHETVKTGAGAFLWAEYTVCAVFTVVFGAIILVMTARLPDPNMPGEVIWDWKFGGLTLASFIVGSFTSIVSGYIGMTVISSSQTPWGQQAPWPRCMPMRFPGGRAVSSCFLVIFFLPLGPPAELPTHAPPHLLLLGYPTSRDPMHIPNPISWIAYGPWAAMHRVPESSVRRAVLAPNYVRRVTTELKSKSYGIHHGRPTAPAPGFLVGSSTPCRGSGTLGSPLSNAERHPARSGT